MESSLFLVFFPEHQTDHLMVVLEFLDLKAQPAQEILLEQASLEQEGHHFFAHPKLLVPEGVSENNQFHGPG